MPKPHFWNHNDVDHQPDFTDVSTSTYTTLDQDDIVRITGNCAVTLHDPEAPRYITISQVSGTSTITGTGFSDTLPAGYTLKISWDGSAWGSYMVTPTSIAYLVLSVFGRTGDVVAVSGDYDLSEIGAGTIAQLNGIISDLITTYGGVRDFGIGTTAQRPAFGTANRFWWSTDDLTISRDTGSAWEELQTLPDLHAASHQDGGSDEISVANLSGKLADEQDPTAHASEHTDGTDDIQNATNAQKGLATAAHIQAIEQNTADITGLETGYNRRTAVIGIVVSTSVPPTEVLGDRYILDNSGTPHANWDGASQADIVEYNGTTWDAVTPLEGYVAYSDSDNKDALCVDDGTLQWELRAVAVANHNDTANKQGGTTAEYYHMTSTEHTEATRDATNVQNGLATASHITDIESNNTHRADTVNPHATDVGNLGSGTIGELNTALTDATVLDEQDVIKAAKKWALILG